LSRGRASPAGGNAAKKAMGRGSMRGSREKRRLPQNCPRSFLGERKKAQGELHGRRKTREENAMLHSPRLYQGDQPANLSLKFGWGELILHLKLEMLEAGKGCKHREKILNF